MRGLHNTPCAGRVGKRGEKKQFFLPVEVDFRVPPIVCGGLFIFFLISTEARGDFLIRNDDEVN